MATKSLDVDYVISDKETAERFAKIYWEGMKRGPEDLPDADELLRRGRELLASGALFK